MNLKKAADQGKDMLTPREVADRSGIGVNAIYQMLKQNRIPHITLGRTMLIPRPQYEHWLATVKGSFDGPYIFRPRKEITPKQRAAMVKNARKAREAWVQQKSLSNGQTELKLNLFAAVRKIRKACQESQETFSRRVGVTTMSISRIERGHQVPTDFHFLNRLEELARSLSMNDEAQLFNTAKARE